MLQEMMMICAYNYNIKVNPFICLFKSGQSKWSVQIYIKCDVWLFFSICEHDVYIDIISDAYWSIEAQISFNLFK